MMRKIDRPTLVLAESLEDVFLAVPQAPQVTFPSQTSRSKLTLLEFFLM